MIDGKNVPSSIGSFIQNFDAKNYDKSVFKSNLQTFSKDINDNYEFYKSEFGTNFWELNHLIKNFLAAHNFFEIFCLENQEEFVQMRENAIIDNFKEIYKRLPKGKFYGQWGMEHIYLSGIETEVFKENQKRFAIGLNIDVDSPVRSKVCSLGIMYFDSFYLDDMEKRSVLVEMNLYKGQNEISAIRYCMKDDITFFKLDSENSPFRDKAYFLNISNEDSVTTDYFQYIIAVKDSSACTYKFV